MLPELVVVGAVGSLLSAVGSITQYALQVKKRNSVPVQILNKNLRKVGKFWSEVNSKIEEGGEDLERQHQDQYTKTILVMGSIFFFLSWLGFIFQLIIIFSISVFPVFRSENALLASELATQDLSIEKIQEACTNLESRSVGSASSSF